MGHHLLVSARSFSGSGGLAAAIVPLVVLALVASAGRALASNLIPGSEFDTSSDLTMHWANLSPDKVWSSQDRWGRARPGRSS